MTKDQFSQALALYTRNLTSGTFSARAQTKQVLLDEHARLVDGIAAICAHHREGNPITYASLIDLLQSDPVTKTLPIRFHEVPDPAHKVVILGEETGHTDGLNESPRWLPGDSKPQSPGVYPTKINVSVRGKPTEQHGRSYWTGAHWGVQRDRAELVKTENVEPSAYQRKAWINEKLDA